jgi:hypothetical protein
LRPGPVARAVDDDVADLLGPQLLGQRGEAHDRVHLAVREQSRRLVHRVRHPRDVPRRVEAHVGRHAGDIDPRRVASVEIRHGDGLALQVEHAADGTIAEQHEAPCVNPAERHDPGAPIDVLDERSGELKTDVDRVRLRHRHGVRGNVASDVPHVGESFEAQEFFRHVYRPLAAARELKESQRRGLGWRFRARLLGSESDESRGSHQGRPTEELTAAPLTCPTSQKGSVGLV